MAVIDVINQNGEVVGTYDLNDTVFGIEPHKMRFMKQLNCSALPCVRVLLLLSADLM